jgi:glycosyltransferase involved in cell wall biosynthesis
VACLDSIKRQTYTAIELIVVDNHSTDATQDIARRYTEKVYEWGPERSAQVNYGVRHATGEYVYKVDSDFVLEPSVVESCMREIVNGADAVVVHNSPDVSVSWIARVRKFEVDMYKYDLTHSSARFLAKEVYESISGFDESVTAGEDYDFQNRLNAGGYRTGFISAEALHLGEPTSLWQHMQKYYKYGMDFVSYAHRNPRASMTQLSFVRGVYMRNWRQFLKHPLRASAFIGYNCCKFAFGGAGFLVGTLSTLRSPAADHQSR